MCQQYSGTGHSSPTGPFSQCVLGGCAGWIWEEPGDCATAFLLASSSEKAVSLCFVQTSLFGGSRSTPAKLKHAHPAAKVNMLH